MATPAQEEMVNRMVRIHMEVMGTDISGRQLQAYADAVYRSITGSNNLEKATNKVRQALIAEGKSAQDADALIKKWSTSTGTASKNTNTLTKSLEGLHGIFTGLLGPVTGFGALLGAQSLAIGSVIADIGRLNTSLISGSGSWAKYGVGTANFEKNMKQIAASTHLTQSETIELLSSYEKGFNNVSMGNAVQVMKNLKAAVGANKEAMSSMLGVISNVVEKFPDLETSITRLNSSDRQRLSLQNQLMVLNGTMGLSQAKTLQDYLQGNRQQEQADQQRQKQVEDQVEALKDLRRMFEEIARTINDTLMPYIEKIVKGFTSAKDAIMKWVPAIATVVGAFIGLRAVVSSIAAITRGISITKGALGLTGNSTALSGLGMAGSIGGTAVLATGGAIAAASGFDALNEHFGGQKREQQGTATRRIKAGVTVLGGVGAGALTGAAIGAFGGPLGAAAGALIGAIAGIGYALWDWHKQTMEIAKYQQALAPELKKHQDELIAEFGGVAKTAHDFNDSLRENVANRIKDISRADEERSGYRVNQLALGKSDDEISESSDGKAFDDKLEKARTEGINAVEEAYRSSAAAGDELAQQYYALMKKRVDLEIQIAQMEDDRRKGKDVDQRSIDQAKTQIAQINDVGELGDDGKPKQGGGLKYLSGQMDQFGKEAQINTALRMKRDADAARRRELAESNGVRARYALDLGNTTAYNQIRDNVARGQSDLETRVATTDGLPASGDPSKIVKSQLNKQDIDLLQQQGVKGSKMEAGGAISLSSQSQKDLDTAKERVKALLEAAQAQKANSSSLAEQNAAEAQIVSLKHTQKALDHDINEVIAGRQGIDADIAAMNGNVLSLMNEQRIKLESINKLYQAQVGLTASVASNMSATGRVNLGDLDAHIGESIDDLRKKNEELQKILLVTDNNLRDQRKVSVQTPDNRAALSFALGGDQNLETYVQGGKTVQEQAKINEMVNGAIITLKRQAASAVDPKDVERYSELAQMLDTMSASSAEQESKRLELQRAQNEAAKQEQEIRMSVVAAFQSQLDYQEKMITSASQQVELADSLGAGLKASVQMRMQEAQAVQKEIEQEQALLAELGKQAKAYEDAHPGQQAMDIRNKMLDVENKITSQHLKQAQILKTLRDGYVSAMQSMVAGTGMFSKILITQDKNLGFGLKQLNVLQSKSSGGIGGGSSTPAGQFTQDGMIFGNQGPGYRLDTPGGGTSNWNPTNGFSREAAENEIARRNAAARAAAGSASTMGANPNVSGAMLGDAAGRRDGGLAGYFADGGMPLGHMGLSRHKDGVTGLIKGESERGDQYQIGVAGGEVIMNQRQWPRVASALGMSQAEFAGMVTAKDYTKLPTDRFAGGGIVGGMPSSTDASGNDVLTTTLKSIDNKLTITNQLLSSRGSPNSPASTVSPNFGNTPIFTNRQTSLPTEFASQVGRPQQNGNGQAVSPANQPNTMVLGPARAPVSMTVAKQGPQMGPPRPKPLSESDLESKLKELQAQQKIAQTAESQPQRLQQAQDLHDHLMGVHGLKLEALNQAKKDDSTSMWMNIAGGQSVSDLATGDNLGHAKAEAKATLDAANAQGAKLDAIKHEPKYQGPSTKELGPQIDDVQRQLAQEQKAKEEARMKPFIQGPPAPAPKSAAEIIQGKMAQGFGGVADFIGGVNKKLGISDQSIAARFTPKDAGITASVKPVTQQESIASPVKPMFSQPLHYLTSNPDPEHHKQHRSHVHQQMNGGFNNNTHVYPNANIHQVHHEQHLPMAMKHATNSVIDTSLMTPAQKAAYQSTVATRSAGDKIADKVMADSIARHKADTASSPEMLASIAKNKGLASSIPIKSKGTLSISPLLPKPITSPVASAKKPPDAVPAAGKPVVTAAQPQVQADPNATSGQVPAAGPSRPVLPPSQPANAVTTTATNSASDAAQGGGAGMPITFNAGGIKVDYGDLNKFGTIVKQQIDASLVQFAKSMGKGGSMPATA